MKKLGIVAVALLAASAWAQVYVAPHVRQDGTFVQGHYRSAPDHSRLNNYSTQGNINPYTGQAGTVNPYPNPYSSGSAFQPPQLPQLPQLPGLPQLPRY